MAALEVTAPPVLLPNNHRQRRTNTPSCGTAATGAVAGAGAGAGSGIGTIGAAEAGRMLGTNGTSPWGFLSRLPIFESSTLG